MKEGIRERLRKGEVVFGVFCKTTDPNYIEILGHSGFDFCILDREHGTVSLERLPDLIRAAECSGMVPVVRTPDSRAESVSQPLDCGAGGVQVPQVGSAEEAREIIRAAKFAPLGERGVCRFVRGAQFSAMDRADYFRKANEALLILQLEGKDIREYEAIAELEAVDVLFIGPYDLSQAVGYPGQIEHPEVLAVMQRIVDAARAKKKAVGVFADTPEQVARWIAAGVQYIAYSVDVGIFTAACRRTLAAIRPQS